MKETGKTHTGTTRRQFMAGTAAAAVFSIVPRHVLAGSGQQAPSDKLNIGCVGVGGMQGGNDVRNVSGENIYALCDVDENHMAKTAAKLPECQTVPRFPRDAGQGAQEPRRDHRHHP